MITLSTLWLASKGPVDYGLYRPNGLYRPVEIINDGYRLLSEMTYDITEDRVCPLYTAQTLRHGNLIIYAGETSWESDGFVALADNADIKWLLQLPEMEQVKELRLELDTLVIETETYPLMKNIRLNLENPCEIHTLIEKNN